MRFVGLTELDSQLGTFSFLLIEYMFWLLISSYMRKMLTKFTVKNNISTNMFWYVFTTMYDTENVLQV